MRNAQSLHNVVVLTADLNEQYLLSFVNKSPNVIKSVAMAEARHYKLVGNTVQKSSWFTIIEIHDCLFEWGNPE